MLELKLLGGAVLRRTDAALPRAATHRHSLALLALLACAPDRTLSRGKLVGLLWPDVPEDKARSRLSTTVHRLRKALGNDAIVSIGPSLRLSDERVQCDVCRFRAHLDAGNPTAAIDVYGGPFLDGFWLRGSREFDDWMERKRDRLRREYRAALESAAEEAARASEPEIAARWWRLRAREDPYDSRVTLRLMESLEAAGNRAAALRAFSEHARVLEEELGTEPNDAATALAQRLGQPSASIAANGGRAGGAGGAAAADSRSLAVLPFEAVGGSEEARVFAAGLHHDLLTRLSRIEDLKVISRTSVLRYRGGDIPVPGIARELGVGTIVEGGVQHVAGRLRLNVQMIEVGGDTHRWAETYDEALDAGNLFDVQSELAEKIANRLRAELTRHDRQRVGERSSADLEAYLLYVQGRNHLSRRSERGIGRAVEYFRRAIDREPDYAAAWAGLAGAWALENWYGYASSGGPGDAMEAARRAVELDPDLSESHTALGIVFSGMQEGPAARRAFRRAIELEPNDAEPQAWLGWVELMLGRPTAALAPARRAAELDPMAPYTRAFLGLLYLSSGQSERALTEARAARELQPDFEIPYFVEGLALHHLDRLAEATFAYEECLTLVGADGALTRPQVQAALAVTRAAAGDAASPRSLLEDVRAAADLCSEGLVQAALREPAAALTAFQGVRSWGPFPTALIRYLFPRVLAPLRSDPRFRAVLDSVNRSWGLRPDGSVPATMTPPRSVASAASAVAVLPFQELGEDSTSAFADGVHNDLITRLSRVAGLNVISRTSVLRYRGSGASVPDIAAELGVDAIVEGSVQHTGGRIRLNVQLVEGRGDVQQWAESYDRTLTAGDLFDIQSELADRIARSLGQELTPRERERVIDWTPTRDLEAYRLYAQGRARLDARTQEGMRRALELFGEAVDRDEGYALAWVGSADALTLLHEYGYEPADRVLPRAEAAARQALELDPGLAEAHASTGLLFEARRQGSRAIQALERAVELQPGYAEAHNWLSWTHQLLGRPSRALDDARRAVALNPLSTEAVSNLAVSHLINRDARTALAEARRARELQPAWTTPHFYEALALFDLERYTEAGEVLQDLHVSWADDGAEVTAALVHCLTGQTELARQRLAEYDDAGDHCATGLLHAALGDEVSAFASLSRIEVWSYWATLSVHHYYPGVLGGLREDPRYRPILERANRAWGLAPDGSFPAH